MYNVTQEQIDSLRTLLNNNNIIITEEYTDNQLAGMIQQAVTLIGEDYITGRVEVDYDYNFTGNLYSTAEYPVEPEGVTVTLDDQDITTSVKSVTREGVIQFTGEQNGVLRVEYTVGLTSDVSEGFVNLATLYLIRGNTSMGDVASINEGDVSVSYNTSTSTRNSLDSVISEIHNQFGARVRMI